MTMVNAIIVVLAVAFSVFGGYFAGRLIAKHSGSEVKQGRKILGVFFWISLLISVGYALWYKFHKTPEALAVSLSLFFLSFLLWGSLDYAKK
jgi:uncharacterized membrane protein